VVWCFARPKEDPETETIEPTKTRHVPLCRPGMIVGHFPPISPLLSRHYRPSFSTHFSPPSCAAKALLTLPHLGLEKSPASARAPKRMPGSTRVAELSPNSKHLSTRGFATTYLSPQSPLIADPLFCHTAEEFTTVSQLVEGLRLKRGILIVSSIKTFKPISPPPIADLPPFQTLLVSRRRAQSTII
jgi:hypothetical protein